MQRRAIDDLTGAASATSSPPPRSRQRRSRGYVTPRRLTVIADGIPATPARPQRGAARPARRRAAAGARRLSARRRPRLDRRSARCATPAAANSISRSSTGRAAPAAEVLPELLRAAIAELPWPKSMRYPGGVTALGAAADLGRSACSTARCCRCALDRVPVGRTTRGHRFLSPGEIAVDERRRLSRRSSSRPMSCSTRTGGAS